MPRNRKQVRVGPGKLWIGTVGAVEPATLAAEFSAVTGNPWSEGPYTNEGTTFTITPSFEDVTVAEEYDPLDTEQTGRGMQVALAVAQHGADMLQIALNGGTITTASNVAKYEPPDTAAVPTAIALGWDSRDRKERYVWRRLIQVGDIETARRRAPDKALLPLTLRLLLPTGAGVKPFAYWEDVTP